MELILWRHAEAKHGLPDDARTLSSKGRKQAAKMASWLEANLPQSCKILVSPTARTIQTAEALGRKFRIHSDIGPDCDPEKILKTANWPHSRETVLIVGHQPALGQIAAMLIAGVQQEWRIRRGNVWWIAQRERGESVEQGIFLRTVIAPDMIATNSSEPR
jgi:phosphohistidine phosphatase